MDYQNLPKRINSGSYRAGHCQGIAVDLAKGYVYYSFTTMLVKTDLLGNFIGSVTGLCGHLGCIAFHPEDGRVYGSLEYKNDAIGKGILAMLGGGISIPDRFYIAIFDVDKIDGADMDSAGIMTCAFLEEVLEDYLAEVTFADGTTGKHRYGCSGIDGVTIAPDFGAPADSERFLFVAYGVYSDTARTDNDYQVILKYRLTDLLKHSAGVKHGEMHQIGPGAPISKYFVYTGNTTYGVQNMEYDPASGKVYLAVYAGKKEVFPNPPMFAIDASVAPKKKTLRGVFPEEEGQVLTLDETGVNGILFPHGSTGLAALGDGYFYVSHHGNGDGMQWTQVRLYRMEKGNFYPVEE